MTIHGTNRFVSFAHAMAYFRPQFGGGTRDVVERKLRTHEIELGVPKLTNGDRLRVIDGGKRYAIERDDS